MDISPQGYTYGSDPQPTIPFWHNNKLSESEIRHSEDQRWVGLEEFPEDYHMILDTSKNQDPGYVLFNSLQDKTIPYVEITELHHFEDSTNSSYDFSEIPRISGKEFIINSYVESQSSSFFITPVNQKLNIHKIEYKYYKGKSTFNDIYINIYYNNPIWKICLLDTLDINSLVEKSVIRISVEGADDVKCNDRCIVIKQIVGDIDKCDLQMYDSSANKLISAGLTLFLFDPYFDKVKNLEGFNALHAAGLLKPSSEFHEEDW